MERREERNLWELSVILLSCGIAARSGLLICISLLVMSTAEEIREKAWTALDPINSMHKNRGFDSFTEEEAYHHLRFHLRDLPILEEKLGFPNLIVLKNGSTCTVIQSYSLFILYTFIILIYNIIFN
jgi:hypothetical protein